jgi:hypothetical protein
MSETKKKWTKVGEVRKGKEGNHYLKVAVRVAGKEVESVTLKTGQNLALFDPRKRPGITEEQAEKIPAFVKYEVMFSEE